MEVSFFYTLPRKKGVGMSKSRLPFLEGYGAHLVLLDGKKPIHKGWQQNKPPMADVSEHYINGGSIGIIPASVGCVVVDVDSNDGDLVSEVIDTIGKNPLTLVSSNRGWHIWYKKTSPGIPNMVWRDGDIRCNNGYVKIWNWEFVCDAIEDQTWKYETHCVGMEDLDKLPKKNGMVKGNRNNELNKRVFEDAKKGNLEAIEAHKRDALDAGLSVGEVESTVQSAKNAAQQSTLSFERKDGKALGAALDIMKVETRWNSRGLRHEFRKKGDGNWDWQAMDSLSSAALRDTIATQFNVKTTKGESDLRFGRDGWMDALNALCHKKRVDPFIDWLENLPDWDKTPRINAMLCHLFGVEDTMLDRWCSRYPVIGAIQRGYAPGDKIDEFPIYIGDQGIGKSAFLRNLLPPKAWDWFSDSCDVSMNPKERAEALQGRVIVEFAEMTGYTRAQIEDIKAFLSRQDDGSIRLAYRTDPERLLRRCVFAGTSNEYDCLPNDYTGLRRFVPCELKHGSDIEAFFNTYRHQIWAEGLVMYKDGIKANLPRPLYGVQAERAEAHRRADDELENAIAGVHVTEGDIYDIALSAGIISASDHIVSKSLQTRMGYTLRLQGWKKKQTMEDGVRKVLWTRETT